MDRRATARTYDALLPEFFPVRLAEAFVDVDFVVGGDGAGLPGRRHPAWRALSEARVALDTRVSPRRMLAWLRSMPSYRAGVPLRLGQAVDAGLQFDKAAELIELLDPGRSLTYLTRRPFAARERAFFAAARPGVLLVPTVSPGDGRPGVDHDPLELVRSAVGLDPRALHWVVGPLGSGAEAEAARLLEALPRGSRLTLDAPPAAGSSPSSQPLEAAGLARLEARAHALGHHVTAWRCRGSLARVGRGFPDVDRLTGQADLARRAHDLITCASCPSRTQCHGPLDEAALLARLDRELGVLGLRLTAPAQRTGPRAYRLEVAEPAGDGDEAYLSHALGQPVAVTVGSRQRLDGAGRAPGDPDPAVLRRWFATGFLPVTELNAAAEKVLEDLDRRLSARAPRGLEGPAAEGGVP